MPRQRYSRKELHNALKTHKARMAARRKVQSERVSIVVYGSFRPNKYDPVTNKTRTYKGPFVYQSKYNWLTEEKKHAALRP